MKIYLIKKDHLGLDCVREVSNPPKDLQIAIQQHPVVFRKTLVKKMIDYYFPVEYSSIENLPPISFARREIVKKIVKEIERRAVR